VSAKSQDAVALIRVPRRPVYGFPNSRGLVHAVEIISACTTRFDFSRPHHRLRLLAFPMRTDGGRPTVEREISRFPRKERLHMPFLGAQASEPFFGIA
jgi:hypothetical protein